MLPRTLHCANAALNGVMCLFASGALLYVGIWREEWGLLAACYLFLLLPVALIWGSYYMLQSVRVESDSISHRLWLRRRTITLTDLQQAVYEQTESNSTERCTLTLTAREGCSPATLTISSDLFSPDAIKELARELHEMGKLTSQPPSEE